MNKFDQVVTGALDIAYSEALKRKNSELAPAHLIWGLAKNPKSQFSKSVKKYWPQLQDELNILPSLNTSVALDQLRPSPAFSKWLTEASSHAIQDGRQEVSERDLLKYLPQYFPKIQFNPQELKLSANGNGLDEDIQAPDFLINLNEQSQEGKFDPVIGRDREIRSVIEILGRRKKNNPVLVGNAGVGKTAIVEGLADLIRKDQVPDVLKGKTVYSLEMGSLMAGTKFRGEFEERIQHLLKFIKKEAGQSLLFIDEIHLLVGAGKTDGAMDAANLLKPALARGELHCIGATTPEEFQKYILGDSALERRFRQVMVDAPTISDSINILMGLQEKYEMHHGVKISNEAIYQAVILSEQYITNKNLPDKAIDLIDEAASLLKLSAETMPNHLLELESEIRSKSILSQVEKNNKDIPKEIHQLETKFAEEKRKWDQEVLGLKKVSELKNRIDQLKIKLENAELQQNYEEASKIKYSQIPECEQELKKYNHAWILLPEHVAQVITRQTGIPEEKILQSRQEHILELKDYLNSQVYGQEESLEEIAGTLVAAHAGLTDHTRPLGSFLLLGPSGVGKTETAKSLSRFLFNTEKNLIRVDMSEFSEKHSVGKLIGAPAGYVGYEEGGILTEAIRKKPYSVILFDEIEKAHPDFADILLQILDDGRLTDNKGRTINFQNTVIVLTSNSADYTQDFKKEVLGRLDNILHYKALNAGIMDRLVEKQVELLNKRLQEKKVSVTISKDLLKELAKEGLDAQYGARPLQSLFHKKIVRPLSQKLLQGQEFPPEILIEKDPKNPEALIIK